MNTFYSILIVIFAAAFAIFQTYPAPPQSPLLYQWEHTQGRYFEINKFEIFYKDVIGNNESSETLLCLHGFPTASFDYYLVLPSLRKLFKRIIFLDFLGLGFSDKPRFHTYSIFEQTSIVEHLLDLLKLKKVHVLAHDYGDTVAQELLARQRDGYLNFEIKSVCLLNGGIFPSMHKPRWSQKILLLPVVGTVASKFINHFVFRIGLNDVFGPNTKPSAADIHNFWYLTRLKDGYRVLGLLLSYIEERHANEERWVGALQRSDIPIHMIYGPADPVNPPPFQDHYRKIIPKPSITVLPDHIGHYVQLEGPEEMMSAYIDFLKKIGVKAENITVELPAEVVK